MVEKSHTGGFWPSFYEPLRSAAGRLADFFAPPSEAKVNEAGYVIRIELPGVAEDDIEVSLHDGVVTVKGEKRVEREEEGDSWYFSELQYGAFARSFRLPPEADPEAIRADLRDGVLVITVGKRGPATAGGARIPVGRG
ncbi:Hsp20/alpha crystallin family protein [Actibacterium sp. MT2.3-13A]|uniref:Hsp20/alpha crystallin family protein n=1 Tax=Actibacterium sp. MT2.3-13A TaxID=2828332 RepID=UPI001BAE50AC|nr:Hsp20/alpha crystallin family protein [Actibacterium sp. MT2.3-13A]